MGHWQEASVALKNNMKILPFILFFVIFGRASYYSRSGCLGCSKNFTMANGQPLDDSAYTVAMQRVKLGTLIRITNTRNGAVVVAIVTDRGGFERHGRIMDMSVAVKKALDMRTDRDIIKAEVP